MSSKGKGKARAVDRDEESPEPSSKRARPSSDMNEESDPGTDPELDVEEDEENMAGKEDELNAMGDDSDIDVMGMEGEDDADDYEGTEEPEVAPSPAASGRNKNNSAAGIIRKIVVKNFMCHRHLVVSLNKNINFINGDNGSGKSAILAALQICLGARAHLTHRASRLNDLIRAGHEGDAEVEVTLLNDENGFEHDKFGNSITVRRVISHNGSSPTLLLAEGGAVVSRNKADLTRMLDALNIQVDNPCAVLDQENAKKFLQGSAKDKYAFFMKATDLDRVLRQVGDINRKAKDMRAQGKAHYEKIPALEVIVRELERQLKEYQAVDKLEAEIRVMSEHYGWSLVDEQEEAACGIKAELSNCEKTMAKCDSFAAAAEAKAESLQQELRESEERSTSWTEEGNQAKQRVVEAKRAILEATQPVQAKSMDIKQAMREQESSKQAKKRLESKLRGLRAEALRLADDSKQRQLLKDIQACEQKLAELEQREPVLRAQLEAATPQMEATAAALRDAQGRFDEGNYSLRREQDLLTNAQRAASDKNPLRAHGASMPRLVGLLQQNAGRFDTPPVGPISAHVKLVDQYRDYGACVEACIGSVLGSFIVNNARDKSTLQQMIRSLQWGGQNGAEPSIVVQPPHARYRVQTLPEPFLQISSAVAIENDVVWNVVIDQTKMEREVMFPDQDSANRHCLLGSRGHLSMPHGLRQTYYLSGTNCNLMAVRNGNVNTRTQVGPGPERRMLGRDTAQQLQHLEASVAALREQVQQAQPSLDQARQAERQAQSEYRRANSELLRVQKDRRALAVQKEQLNREHQDLQAANAQEIDTTDTEAELDSVTQDIDARQQALATMQEEHKELKAALGPLEEVKKEVEQQHQELLRKLERFSSEYHKQTEAIQEQRTMASRSRTRKETEERQKALLEKRLEARQREVDAAMENAKLLMQPDWDGERPRVPAGHTPAVLQKRIEAAEARVDREKKRRGVDRKSREEVEDQLENAKKVVKEKKDRIKKLMRNLKMIEGDRADRIKRWQAFRSFISRQTRNLFDHYLQKKGASGDVVFDIENKELRLIVQKDNMDQSSQSNDVKQLSGGERSFATLSLLMAMGSEVECPFRVMDEFDVFMDAVARNTAIREVISFARDRPEKQFIFITPQNLNQLTPQPDLMIFKMTAPRAGVANQPTLHETLQRR